MKLNATVLLALFIIAVLFKAGYTKKDAPAFVQSLRNLHRGPPDMGTRITKNVQTKWITQKLDHFDEKNNKTWEMRYMVNEQHFKEGGPMFIYLGGEWPITPGAIEFGIFPDLAKEHNGILFYTEHRYYGSSQPTSNISTENLQFLHVRQALADLAHFIRFHRETNGSLANSKVILAGGSYSATMVVWFSKLYPELVNGGWASSAPLLAKVDFKEYQEMVGKAIKELGSQECYNRINNGIAELENMFDNKRSAEVKAMLQLCNTFNHNNDLDLWSLFGTISNLFSSIVQYQQKGEISHLCNNLMSFPDDLTAIATFVLHSTYKGQGCVDVTYKSTLQFYRYVYNTEEGARSWYYQTCNEFGWYQGSTSTEQPFGSKFPVTLYTILCKDIFDAKYTNKYINESVNKTNAVFGGLNPQVKNVYMTHGGLDPWSAVGHNEKDGASVIPQASHCADFNSISMFDSDEMRTSKQRLIKLVREWLA